MVSAGSQTPLDWTTAQDIPFDSKCVAASPRKEWKECLPFSSVKAHFCHCLEGPFGNIFRTQRSSSIFDLPEGTKAGVWSHPFEILSKHKGARPITESRSLWIQRLNLCHRTEPSMTFPTRRVWLGSMCVDTRNQRMFNLWVPTLMRYFNPSKTTSRFYQN